MHFISGNVFCNDVRMLSDGRVNAVRACESVSGESFRIFRHFESKLFGLWNGFIENMNWSTVKRNGEDKNYG